MKKGDWKLTLFVIFLSSVISIAIYNLFKKETFVKPDKNWKKAVARIESKQYINVENYRVSYNDSNGKWYEKTLDGLIEGAQIGDAFIMEYNTKNPAQSIVYTDKPVFINVDTFGGQKVINAIGKVERIYSWALSPNGKHPKAVSFSYRVNGINYKRSQNLPGNHEEYFPLLKEGNLYLVRYLSKQPKRAIIYLNNPK